MGGGKGGAPSETCERGATFFKELALRVSISK